MRIRVVRVVGERKKQISNVIISSLWHIDSKLNHKCHIRVGAFRLYSRYLHLFLDDLVDSWALISVLDDIPLEWVEIWENDPEKEEWVSAIEEDNRILRLGLQLKLGRAGLTRN